MKAGEALGLALLVLLSGLCHAAGESRTFLEGGPSLALWAVLAGTAAAAAAALAWRRRADLLDVRFLFLCLFLMGHVAKPALALFSPELFTGFFAARLPGDRLNYWSSYNLGLLLSLAGLAALLLGMHWHRGVALLGSAAPRLPRRLSRRRVTLLSAALLLVGYASYAVLVIRTGGAADLLRHADTSAIGLGPLVALTSLAWPVGPLLGWVGLSRGRFKPAEVLLLAAWLPSLAFFASRGQFVFVASAFLILWNVMRKRIRLGHLAATGILLFGLSLSIIAVRINILHYGEGPGLGPAFLALTAVQNDFSHFDNLVYLVGQHRGGVFPLLGGATFVDMVLYPIPRALWSGKPTYLGTVRMQVAAAAGYREESSFSFSFLGEWYGNFGPASVVGGAFLVGLFLGALSWWYRRARDGQRSGDLLLYACCAVWICVALDRGGFGLLAVNLITYFPLLLGLGLLLCGQRSGPGEA